MRQTLTGFARFGKMTHRVQFPAETRQTAKGKQLCCPMRAQIAVDSRSKFLRTVLVSAANVVGRDALTCRLHRRETWVWGRSG